MNLLRPDLCALCRCACLALAIGLPLPALASPDWFAEPYRYRVLDQDVRGVLGEFGRNLGVPVILSDQVRGRVRGDIQAADARAFLDRVAAAAGLSWYLDGDAVVVDAARDVATRSFDVRRYDAQALDRLLDSLGPGAGIAARLDAHQALLAVSGPPGYIAHVQRRLDSLRPRGGAAPSLGVRVFRGGADTEVASDRS